ncbi:MAG: divergent polysaccharide deacetylase family protein [Deltaproteobacteria bacterium]|nr:divergent polysaccharide deacetylase family protein [Deltaproteobacteria bacterium]
MSEKKINKLFLIIPVVVIVVIFSAAVYYKFVVSKKRYREQPLLVKPALKIKEYKKHPVKNFKKFFKKTLTDLKISKTDIIKQHIDLNIKAPVNFKNNLKRVGVSFLKYDILISKNGGFGPIENIFNDEFKNFIIPSKAGLKYYSYAVKNNCLCLYFYFKSKLFLKAVFIVKGINESGFTSIREYAGSPKIALDIDDVGYRRSYINSLISLKTPITFAIFPYAHYSKDIDLKLHKLGYETIMHTPMEPVDTALFPGDGALFISMDKKEIRRKISADIKRLPYIDGANNHEGSLFTSDKKKICDAVSDFKKKNMFFMDSLTDDNSYAYRCALKQGIPSAQRDVFIDDKPADGYIENQIKIAAALAKRFKRVIVIGHPRSDTVKTLMSEIPALKKEGYKFVPLCEFLR